MLTQEDYKNLYAIISSPQLSLTGNQAKIVAMLQWKLEKALTPQPPAAPANETEKDGDDSRSAK